MEQRTKIKGAVAALEEWWKMNMDMVCCLHTEVSIPQKERTNQAIRHTNTENTIPNSGTYYLGGIMLTKGKTYLLKTGRNSSRDWQ